MYISGDGYISLMGVICSLLRAVICYTEVKLGAIEEPLSGHCSQRLSVSDSLSDVSSLLSDLPVFGFHNVHRCIWYHWIDTS